jgi:hypothetical protein
MTRAVSGFKTCIPVVLALLVCALANPPAPAGGEDNPGVLPINSNFQGYTYGEWSALSWQWTYSLPLATHPLFGDDNDPSQNQPKHLWFLGGTFSAVDEPNGDVLGEADRNIKVPSGTALWVQMISAEASVAEGNGDTEEELRDFARFLMSFVDPDSLFCTVDGKALKDPADYYAESPLFVWGPLPEGNIFDDPVHFPAGQTSPSVAAGYYVLLAPLPVGKHTLHFGGIADFSSLGAGRFIQNIHYEITVVPRK